MFVSYFSLNTTVLISSWLNSSKTVAKTPRKTPTFSACPWNSCERFVPFSLAYLLVLLHGLQLYNISCVSFLILLGLCLAVGHCFIIFHFSRDSKAIRSQAVDTENEENDRRRSFQKPPDLHASLRT